MKMVIEIPEDVKAIIDRKGTNETVAETLWQAVKNGKSLPKGHGRLIDENDLSLMTVHLIDGVFVCNAPTIIEADKEDENADCD